MRRQGLMEMRTDKVAIRHLFLSPGHNFFGHHGQPPGENPLIEMPEIHRIVGYAVLHAPILADGGLSANS